MRRLALAVLLCAACGDGWRTTEGRGYGAPEADPPSGHTEGARDHEPEPRTPTNPPVHTGEILMEEEKVADATPILVPLRRVDGLLITVAGRRFTPRFSTKTLPHDPGFTTAYFDYCGTWEKRVPCPPVPPYPDCAYRFGVHEGDEYEEAALPDDPHYMNLKVQIGGRLHPIGEVVHHAGTEMTARFAVTEEMTAPGVPGTALLVVVADEGDPATAPVGFIGFAEGRDECPDIDEGDGRFRLEQRDRRPYLEYTVTVSAIKKEEVADGPQ